MFFIVEFRPNITFFIAVKACFVKNLIYVYIKAIKTMLHYIKKLINYNIIYGNNKENFSLKSYLDFN